MLLFRPKWLELSPQVTGRTYFIWESGRHSGENESETSVLSVCLISQVDNSMSS